MPFPEDSAMPEDSKSVPQSENGAASHAGETSIPDAPHEDEDTKPDKPVPMWRHLGAQAQPMPDMLPEAEPLPAAEPALSPDGFDAALLSGWRRFLAYDSTSLRLKKNRTNVRRWIIVLGVITSFLAVLITYWQAAKANTQTQDILMVLRVALAVLPILTAILISYAGEFAPIMSWAVYRVGAELIRREIYLYRMKAGPYNLDDDEQRRVAFRNNLSRASRLEKVYETDNTDNTAIQEAVQHVLMGAASVPQIPQVDLDDASIVEQVKSVTFRRGERYRDPTYLDAAWHFISHGFLRLFRRRGASIAQKPEDDGFSELSAQDYIEVRLIPQLNWYSNRVEADYGYMRNWKSAILVMGGLGSVLVALSAIDIFPIHLEPFVAVTTATVTAMGLYVELKMYSHTYLIYHSAARRLQDLLDEWQIVIKNSGTEATDPKIYKQFIVRCERVLQSEREDWMLRVIQSQTALEQKLARSSGRTDTASDTDALESGFARTLKAQGDLDYNNGEYSRARVLYEEALKALQRTADTEGMLDTLEGIIFVQIAIAGSDPTPSNEVIERVATLDGAVQGNRRRLNVQRLPQNNSIYMRRIHLLRNKLSEDQKAAYEAYARTGDEYSLEQAVEFAVKGTTSPGATMTQQLRAASGSTASLLDRHAAATPVQ